MQLQLLLVLHYQLFPNMWYCHIHAKTTSYMDSPETFSKCGRKKWRSDKNKTFYSYIPHCHRFTIFNSRYIFSGVKNLEKIVKDSTTELFVLHYQLFPNRWCCYEINHRHHMKNVHMSKLGHGKMQFIWLNWESRDVIFIFNQRFLYK